jgi:DNA-binding response OmpR family regulator
VDDNVDAAEMMKALLETYQHEVRVAYDGRGALEAVREFEPEIGLFYIGLPDVDGYELARRVPSGPEIAGDVSDRGYRLGSGRRPPACP